MWTYNGSKIIQYEQLFSKNSIERTIRYMDQKTFIDILIENNPESMKDFLLRNGKKPKPFCPLIFHIKDKDHQERED